jgi:hypothetical protein
MLVHAWPGGHVPGLQPSTVVSHVVAASTHPQKPGDPMKRSA